MSAAAESKIQNKPIKSTTLIKYYNFNQYGLVVEGTWYSGHKDTFTAVPAESKGLYYPDEYLIAHILNKYKHQIRENLGDHQIVILTEPWSGSNTGESKRDGTTNTQEMINTLIIEAIQKYKEQDCLILIPFLYGNHHPGLAIDIRMKTATYIDPFGHERYLHHTLTLETELEDLGFTFTSIKTAQQTVGSDGSSCGPILTSTFMEWMDKYLEGKPISEVKLEAPRKKLATGRMLQMRLNNTVSLDDGLNVDEIMLADRGLWEAFLRENGIEATNPISLKILKTVDDQIRTIKAMPTSWKSDPEIPSYVCTARDFQSSITGWVIDKNYEAILTALKINGNPAIISSLTSADSAKTPEHQNKIDWLKISLGCLLVLGSSLAIILGVGSLVTQATFSIGLLSLSLAAGPYVLAAGCIGFFLVALWFFYPKSTKTSKIATLDGSYSSSSPSSSHRPLKSDRQNIVISQTPGSPHDTFTSTKKLK